MEIQQGHIVQATAGRDQGKCFLVLAAETDFLLLADGKGRRVDAPKRKRRKHVRLLGLCLDPVVEKIQHQNPITNSELRKALAGYGKSGNPNQEG